jgi:hypothetical protein
MHLYFFHLHRCGKVILDREGTSLASIDEARRFAKLEARELIIRILATEEPVPFDDGIEVADEQGAVLHRATFEEALK